MNSFQVVLPSNASNDSHSVNNTVAHFRTLLAFPLELQSDWEVALTEISYTNSWYNIMKDEAIHVYVGYNFFETHLRAGRYPDGQTLIGAINEIFNTFVDVFDETPRLKEDKLTRQLLLTYGLPRQEESVKIYFSRNLCLMLGFAEALIINTTYHIREIRSLGNYKNIKGDRPYQIDAGLHSIYVYSNIVKPSIVGDSYSQLLRVVNVKQKAVFGEQVVHSFVNPNFHQVQLNRIPVIEIHLRDDTGATFPFQLGRTIITLHFRKCRG